MATAFFPSDAMARAGRSWDGGPETDGPWNGWLTEHSRQFDSGVSNLKGALTDALDKLDNDPSNATYLADYQEKLSQYNLYRMLQSNSVKSLKDTLSNNVRNVG
ncbi:EscF/YscF/HrpA family type III secretion system needle major subunit [Pinirhizobacter sp.]|jgi:type III secretion protein F|uniref:EscF/YscF/HrpA family type III secretion system needle major subunit n=1 Tax=Pinirhizobacter sp. TaxID=2950432 RepID=UPI002F3FCA52